MHFRIRTYLLWTVAAGLWAGLVACGGDGGKSGAAGENGVAGTRGETGATGDAGRDGVDGQDGADGQDATPYSFILALHAEDELGVENDNVLTAIFAGDVSDNDAELANSYLNMSYSHRDALKFVPDNFIYNSYENIAGKRVLNLVGDSLADGFLAQNAVFGFAFTDNTALAENLSNEGVLQAWEILEAQLNAPGGLELAQYDNSGFSFRATRKILIAHFDADGTPLGTTLTLPAFLFVDRATGRSSESASFLLDDGATLLDAVEPTGIPFSTSDISVETGFLEDGIFAIGSSFVLRFSQPMNAVATREAIKRRLQESLAWTQVDVVEVNSSAQAFQVTVQQADVNLTLVNNSFRLELQPWDVSDANGVANSNASIVFQITDVSAPELVNLAEDENGQTSTLSISLGLGTPERIGNHQLVAGDVLSFRFTEQMESPADDIATAFVESLNSQFALNIDSARVVAAGDVFSLALEGEESIAILGGVIRIMPPFSVAEVSDANGTAVAANQIPTAFLNHWVKAPILVDQSGEEGLGLTLSVVLAGSRENNTLETGDRIRFEFSKAMDVPSTTAAIALSLAGNILGGSKTGIWDATLIQNALTSYALGKGFSYTLTGAQSLMVSGELSFDALSTEAKDVYGLRLLAGQKPMISADVFDPIVPPSLESIESLLGSVSACGDQFLGEGDRIVFRFSEPLQSAQVILVANDIAAKISNLLVGGVLDGTANVGVVNNRIFTATLPEGSALNVANDVAFALNPTNVLDVNGVSALSATGTLAATDALAVELSIPFQNTPGDGLLIGGDQIRIDFSCKMDAFQTLSALQEAADGLFGDDQVRITLPTLTAVQIEFLAGRVFDASAQQTLTFSNVVTDQNLNNNANDRASIAGPFSLSFEDAAVEDVQFTYVSGSAVANEAQFEAPLALRSGQWNLSGVSEGLTRDSVDLRVIYSDFDAPLEVDAGP